MNNIPYQKDYSQMNITIISQQCNTLAYSDARKASEHTERNFTKISNAIIRDGTIPETEFRILCILQSNTSAFEIHTKSIAKKLGRCQRTIQKAFRKLIARGALERRTRYNEFGQPRGCSYRFIGVCDSPSDSRENVGGNFMPPHNDTSIRILNKKNTKLTTTYINEPVVASFDEVSASLDDRWDYLEEEEPIVADDGYRASSTPPDTDQATKEINDAYKADVEEIHTLAAKRLDRSKIRSWLNKYGKERLELVIKHALKQPNIKSFGAYVCACLKGDWQIEASPKPIAAPPSVHCETTAMTADVLLTNYKKLWSTVSLEHKNLSYENLMSRFIPGMRETIEDGLMTIAKVTSLEQFFMSEIFFESYLKDIYELAANNFLSTGVPN